jgi:uncharacterized alpha-E superfamily protein
LRKLQTHIAYLPRQQIRPGMQEDQRLILEAFTQVRLAEVARLVPAGEEGIHEGLERLLAQVSDLLGQLSNALARIYFSHAEGPRLLAADPLEVEP